MKKELEKDERPAGLTGSYAQSLDDFALTPAQRARIEKRAEARREETQGLIDEMFFNESPKNHWEP